MLQYFSLFSFTCVYSQHFHFNVFTVSLVITFLLNLLRAFLKPWNSCFQYFWLFFSMNISHRFLPMSSFVSSFNNFNCFFLSTSGSLSCVKCLDKVFLLRLYFGQVLSIQTLCFVHHFEFFGFFVFFNRPTWVSSYSSQLC